VSESPLAEQHPLAEPALRAAGLKVTESRRAVYDALCALPHASADRIFDRISDTIPSSSVQSVYNALGDFVSAGLARRIEPAGGPRLFELRVGDNHHHIVCSSCGAVQDVDCAVGAAPCLAPSDTHGYEIDLAEVTFWGLCPACSGRSAASAHPFAATEEHRTEGEG
jgi:Fur family ferric uptake transcriptional regulator